MCKLYSPLPQLFPIPISHNSILINLGFKTTFHFKGKKKLKKDTRIIEYPEFKGAHKDHGS